MASRIGMANRNQAANKRIDAALNAIAESGQFDLPDRPARSRDTVYEETQRLEWVADLVEAIAGNTGTDGDNEPEDAEDTGPSLEWTKAQLVEHAESLGIENADRLGSKQVVLDAITEAEQADGDEDAPVEPQEATTATEGA
jgi:hypothetical protein